MEDGRLAGDSSDGRDDCFSTQRRTTPEFRVYKRRWFILLVLCVLNCSNSVVWLTFAPVADQIAKHLHVTLDKVNWLSLVYMVVAIPVSLITTWMLDTWGLRPTMILGSWLNMAGSVLRVVGVLSYLPEYSMFPVVMAGQTLCSLAQPLVIFSPTKLAALWFPEHQRTTANMIASMSNPFGLLFVYIFSPLILSRTNSIFMLLLIYAIPAIVICFLATVGIQESVPPTPPSASADTSSSEPFLQGIRLYFAGLYGALFISFGVLGAAILGFFVDKTKLFTESIKISMCLTSLVCTAFAVVSQMREQKVVIGLVCALFGLFGFATYPVAMELSVECSYPVGEATSAGFLFISGQFLSILYTLLLQQLTTKLTDSSLSVCAAGDDASLSWMVPVLVMAGLCCLASCSFVIFFHTQYRRLNAEAKAAENHSIQTETQGAMNNSTDA
ncbi:solute carrier family 49 member A3 isoform X2 [Hemibagrus wyckioides]|uniref:solute carrier family 49 member A3 isoform X2 n=1 Tax=Hemibagrus wyckioides TaxID=337641 RepID=UPI00266C8FCD|nr:solute carrier family 49 member A3 isoform X2 [Hemibagrus wyckioides]